LAEIDRLLEFLKARGGSDLHLSAGLRAMIRLDGTMLALKGEPLKPTDTDRIFGEIMPAINREEFGQRNDTDFAYDLPGVARFRVNVFRDLHGTCGVLRLIPKEIASVDELGLPEVVRGFCELPKGLVLVTGPTGSGKSTTLAAMIDLINRTRRDHIVTIEDPIEFVHESNLCILNQREVHSHVESFARALRAALREDPDVVLVGEMRDLETAHIAIETAETGHLVFGTLHTTTAHRTVDRLINQFPVNEQEQIRSMIANSLSGVISQTLLKKKPSGRVAAFEVLVATVAVQNCIRERKIFQIPSVMQTGAKHGMSCLNDAILRLVLEGKVDPEEGMSKTMDRQELLQKFQVAGITVDVEGADMGGDA
jgi:twitching motility protein PilT